MAHIVTAGELLDGHSVLDIECLDRIYLNAYVPVLQSSGQVVAFMTQHLGKPIPSPALVPAVLLVPQQPGPTPLQPPAARPGHTVGARFAPSGCDDSALRVC